MFDKLLPEFQKYLLERKLVAIKNIPFYAYRVSQFLAVSNTNKGLSLELRTEKYLNELRGTRDISDWQINQAEEAVKLYVGHFIKKDAVMKTENINFTPLSLIEELRKAIRIKHYSYNTEKTYIDWVKRFFEYLKERRKKDFELNAVKPEDVKEYLSYLALQKNVSASTQNQAFNALLFVFKHILKIELNDLSDTVRAKRGGKLPVVLSVEEVRKLFEHLKTSERLMVYLLYGSGLRLMELARLRVKDVDFGANLIFVRDGKGNKDRSTILPEAIKLPIQSHLKKIQLLHEEDLKSGYGEVYLPQALSRKYPHAGKEWYWQYVFPALTLSIDPRGGKVRRHHVSEKTIQNIVRTAATKAGIMKHVTVHTLRHCFATHLLMNGVNIREIQDLLGHKNVETTMIYTHVMRNMTGAPKSPLDLLKR